VIGPTSRRTPSHQPRPLHPWASHVTSSTNTSQLSYGSYGADGASSCRSANSNVGSTVPPRLLLAVSVGGDCLRATPTAEASLTPPADIQMATVSATAARPKVPANEGVRTTCAPVPAVRDERDKSSGRAPRQRPRPGTGGTSSHAREA